MKAHVPCGALAVLILAACSSRPNPDLFAQGSSQPEKTQTGGAGSLNASGVGSSSVAGDAPAVSNTGGGTSAAVGGAAGMGFAGTPDIVNNTGGAGTAGSESAAGSVGNAGSVASELGGAAGSPQPPPAPVCGNGMLEDGEQCDDAGHTGNGCDANCKVVCSQHGQGVLESEAHHCYAGYNLADFAGSQQDCVKRGAHLATISSAAENKLARGLVNNSKWLGGSEAVSEMSPGTGSYSWLTGEPFDFSNWAPQEPTHAEFHCAGSNAPCYAHCIVMLGDGTWAARRCDVVDGYICEWEPAGTK